MIPVSCKLCGRSFMTPNARQDICPDGCETEPEVELRPDSEEELFRATAVAKGLEGKKIPVTKGYGFRMVEERNRLGFTQADLVQKAGLNTRHACYLPKGAYPYFPVVAAEKLAPLGFDIGYITTGERGDAATRITKHINSQTEEAAMRICETEGCEREASKTSDRCRSCIMKESYAKIAAKKAGLTNARPIEKSKKKKRSAPVENIAARMTGFPETIGPVERIDFRTKEHRIERTPALIDLVAKAIAMFDRSPESPVTADLAAMARNMSEIALIKTRKEAGL